MDELLHKLKESGLGCKLYNVYSGILMYADDILLLCSSITNFQLIFACHLVLKWVLHLVY